MGPRVPNRDSNGSETTYKDDAVRPLCFPFYDLAMSAVGNDRCPIQGMNVWLILLTVQVVVAVIALLRERGEDHRFEGEKLGYRS